MPGGWPELNRPPLPKQDGVPGTPGNPLGPRKKQGRIYPRGKSCMKRKRSMRCPAGTTLTGSTSKYPKIQVNGRGGVMVAFTALSPHAHDILNAVKKWDNPIGATVAWFNDAMNSLQEAIGGKHIPEVQGNELKLWLVCLFRDDNPRWPDAIDKACRRQKDAPVEEQKQKQAVDGLNQVAELCETAEQDPPVDEKLRFEIWALCDKFAATMENMVDANAGLILLGEWVRARTLNNQDAQASDQAAVRGFIEKGAFGPVTNQTEVEEIATLFVDHMSTYAIVEEEADGSQVLIDHDEPPAWLELLQMGAGYVPEDREAVNEALELLDKSPHLRHFDKEPRKGPIPMLRVQTCWDQAGLLAFQPRRWDEVSAGLTYLEGRLRDNNSALACAPCMAPEGFWVLRCGSAVP